MIDKSSNFSDEEINDKLDFLWKEYAKKFNNVEGKSFQSQSETLDEILSQIRALEKLKKK